MGGKGSGRKADPLKNFLPQRASPFVIGEAMEFPNHSGRHDAGTTGTPVNDLDLANKFYVDSNDFWKRVGTILYPKTSGDDVSVEDGQSYCTDGVPVVKVESDTSLKYSNVYIGEDAGKDNTGDQVMVIGYTAGSNGTGNGQLAFGSLAGRSNSGASQTAIGYYSGGSNTGTYQNAIGYLSGKDNDGTNQTAIGYYSGASNTGTYQVTLGYRSGKSNSGNYQVALGNYAGERNTGDECIALGNTAGRLNTGDNCVFLGNSAGASNATANQLIIKQNNINTTPLMQGDFATGQVSLPDDNAKFTLGATSTDFELYSDGTDANIDYTGNLKINGTVGVSATIATAALTPGGANGSMTFVNGILTAQTAAT